MSVLSFLSLCVNFIEREDPIVALDLLSDFYLKVWTWVDFRLFLVISKTFGEGANYLIARCGIVTTTSSAIRFGIRVAMQAFSSLRLRLVRFAPPYGTYSVTLPILCVLGASNRVS